MDAVIGSKYIEWGEIEMIESVSTKKAPAAIGPYSQVVKAGGYLFVSGQIPVNPADNSIPETIEGQARQTFTNLKNILEASGSGLSHVVKTTVFIRSMDDFASINQVYAEFFRQPYPARSCLEVSKLPKGVAIEAEAIAIKSV